MSIADAKNQIKVCEEEIKKRLKSIDIKIKALNMDVKVIEAQNFAKKWKVWSTYI